MSKNYAKRDFKKRPPARKASNLGWLWLVTGMLIGGFGFGLFFLKKNVTVVEQPVTPEPVKKEKAKVALKAADNTSNEDKTNYDFYTLLPNSSAPATTATPTSAESPPAKNTKPLAEAEQSLLSKNTSALTTPASKPPGTMVNTASSNPEATEPSELASFQNPPTKDSKEASSQETLSKTAKKPVDAGVRYSIEVGDFEDYDQADTRKAELTLAGFNHIHIETYMKGDATHHRVLIGHYKSKSEAESLQKELQDNNFSAQILTAP